MNTGLVAAETERQKRRLRQLQHVCRTRGHRDAVAALEDCLAAGDRQFLLSVPTAPAPPTAPSQAAAIAGGVDGTSCRACTASANVAQAH